MTRRDREADTGLDGNDVGEGKQEEGRRNKKERGRETGGGMRRN